jgi:hypothetical protein
MGIESAVGQAGGLHHFGDAYVLKSSFTEQAGSLLDNQFIEPDDPSRETRALRLWDDGMMRFKQSSHVYISEKTYEIFESALLPV